MADATPTRLRPAGDGDLEAAPAFELYAERYEATIEQSRKTLAIVRKVGVH